MQEGDFGPEGERDGGEARRDGIRGKEEGTGVNLCLRHAGTGEWMRRCMDASRFI